MTTRDAFAAVIGAALIGAGILLAHAITTPEPREIVIKYEPIRPIDYAHLDRIVEGHFNDCHLLQTWRDPNGRVAFESEAC